MTASIDEDTSTAPAAPEDGDESEAVPAAKTWRRSLAARWRLLATGGFLVMSVAVAAVVFFGPHRDDRETAAASEQALAAAQEGAVALLSYAPASLDQDLATARSHLTGDFLTYFSQFADQILIPAAKEKDVHASATVVRAAVMDAHPDSAHVLLFINQTTTSRDNPTSAQAASSVNVGLTKVDGTWRISSFDPA
ncbi:twin-arginine translocation pathway signal [Mycobacterium sp. PSTR-4-N]|uniref:twin-arginine translocation pathway signal n=1 Tax=Mycobacterium sp. PSTR-4-N TaxID=2917745 RepID=UPI001F15251B|nr:twin-arginine translocation pathway signal [Mycobacterium sp. PSTR-4-N]MCG7592486.1 twin-arginine translocation pathway signal [Mycobacterium sp. PSTR-4-N]